MTEKESPKSHAHDHSPEPPAHEGGHRHHVKRTPQEWAEKLDAKERGEWQKPVSLISLINLHPGQTVAEIGAGTGYFLKYLSDAVGVSGKVLAKDVEADLVDYIKTRAEKEGLGNVVPSLCPYDDPALPDNSVDKILLVNTWHHITNRVRYAAKLGKALKDRGEIFVVDFNKDASIGPPPEDKLAAKQVMDELEKAGLGTEKLNEDLKEQYVIRAYRQ